MPGMIERSARPDLEKKFKKSKEIFYKHIGSQYRGVYFEGWD